MATFNEVEDLRDFFIDLAGEVLAKIAALNGDEPIGTIDAINSDADAAHQHVRQVICNLDELLIQKKKTENMP